MSTKSIKDIVSYYAMQSYDSVEIEEDKDWSTDDLISLGIAIVVELQKRNAAQPSFEGPAFPVDLNPTRFARLIVT